MFKKVLILMFAVVVGCSVYGDNEPRGVKVSWDQNSDNEGVTHYEVYWWQGDDTLSWNIPSTNYVGDVPHIAGADTAFYSGYQFSYNYIRAGAIAVDGLGRKSTMGLSDFESYHYLFGPSAPANLKIRK